MADVNAVGRRQPGALESIDFGGTGSPVVLLHGMCGSAADWTDFAGLLVSHFRVVAVDLPGHGMSSASLHLRDWTAALEATLDRLQLGRVAVIGHSAGGFLAAVFGAHSRRCRAVVNIDGHMGWTEVRDSAGLPAEDPTAARQDLEPYVFVGRPDELEAHIERLDIRPIAEAALRRRFHAYEDGLDRSRPTLDEYEVLVRESASIPGEELRKMLSVPVLFVACLREPETDIEVGKRAQRALFAELQNVTVVEVGGGHFLHEERPTELLELVTAFVGNA